MQTSTSICPPTTIIPMSIPWTPHNLARVIRVRGFNHLILVNHFRGIWIIMNILKPIETHILMGFRLWKSTQWIVCQCGMIDVCCKELVFCFCGICLWEVCEANMCMLVLELWCIAFWNSRGMCSLGLTYCILKVSMVK